MPEAVFFALYLCLRQILVTQSSLNTGLSEILLNTPILEND